MLRLARRLVPGKGLLGRRRSRWASALPLRTGSLPVAGLLLLAAGSSAAIARPAPLDAQQPGDTNELAGLTSTPESAAELFLRSVRAIRWSAAARFMHEETLDRFYTTARMIAAADTSGEVSRYLVDADSTSLAALEPADVFARSIGATIDGMPGLMHSLYDRDDEVLGHVPEAEDRAHVVYRTTPRLSGAVSEVAVMQLGRSEGGGWRVLWSDELEVLDAALRGVGR